MITRQLLAHCAPNSSLLASLFLDLVPRQPFHSVLRSSPVSIAMASVAYCQITATCDKDSLQARCRSAKVKGMYYTKNEKGDKSQILKKSEFLVAQVLLSEGRSSAVPWVGRRRLPLARLTWTSILPCQPRQLHRSQWSMICPRSRQRESYLLCVSCSRCSMLGN